MRNWLISFAAITSAGPLAARGGGGSVRQGGDAKLVAGPEETGGHWLYRLQPRSFVLQGRAGVVHADRRCITLADVGQGMVVLSMHYQTGMQVLPNQVNIEKDPDASDQSVHSPERTKSGCQARVYCVIREIRQLD